MTSGKAGSDADDAFSECGVHIHEPGDLPEELAFTPRGYGESLATMLVINPSLPTCGKRGFFMAGLPSVPRGTEPKMSKDELGRLTRYFERLAADGFYGKVLVSFQNGKPCDVRIEQTMKLDEL
jgi:hypothetical protein